MGKDDPEAVDKYNDVMLAMRWHQPLDYIRNLSRGDYLDVLNVLDADYKLSHPPKAKNGK